MGDSTRGHSQLSVAILPLTDKSPPENPQEKHPPSSPSGAEGPASTPPKDTSDNPSNLRDTGTVMTTPPEESEHGVTTPPSYSEEDFPTEYPPRDNPEAPLGSEDGLVVPPTNKSQRIPPEDPFSRFWSGQTADRPDEDKKRHRWLDRKSERRHSVDLEALDQQDHRPYRYALRRERSGPCNLSF